MTDYRINFFSYGKSEFFKIICATPSTTSRESSFSRFFYNPTLHHLVDAILDLSSSSCVLLHPFVFPVRFPSEVFLHSCVDHLESTFDASRSFCPLAYRARGKTNITMTTLKREQEEGRFVLHTDSFLRNNVFNFRFLLFSNSCFLIQTKTNKQINK